MHCSLCKIQGDERSLKNCTSDSRTALSPSALFQHHEEYLYPIRGHLKRCRAIPLNFARSFTDSSHHFDSEFYHSENSRTYLCFSFSAFPIHAKIGRNASLAYNESRLYQYWQINLVLCAVFIKDYSGVYSRCTCLETDCKHSWQSHCQRT
jgi:hypothetical protein